MAGPEIAPQIQRLGEEKRITIPLTFLPKGPSAADVANFKINPEARNTILVYVNKRVQANFVNVDEKSFAEVEKAAAAAVGK